MSQPPLYIEQLHKTFYLGLFAPLPKLRSLKLGPLNRVVEAVRGVSLEVGSGEIFGLLGANGAGKSTTIKAAMGLIRPSAGEVRLNGRLAQEPESRRGVGYLPESPTFYDELSPLETLELFGALCGVPAKQRRAEAQRQLSRVGMSQASDRPLRLLSKGMHQRVGVAQALLNHPSLIILDEPLSGLDPVGRREIRDLLLEERDRGATVLLSSHILPDVEALCDRFAMIHEGQIKHAAQMSALSEHMDETELTVGAVSGALRAALEALGAQRVERLMGGEVERIRLPSTHRREALSLILEHEAELIALQANRLTLDELFERLMRSPADQAQRGTQP